MMAALATVFMLVSYFPYLTYAIPAVAGLFIMVCVIETGVKWSLGAYFASAILVFLLAEPEAKLFYVLFFGYYPILKAALESRKNRVVEYLIKFAVFNAAVLLEYGVLAGLFGISLDGLGDFGKYTAVVLLIAANLVFPIYDLAVTRLAQFYLHRLHGSIIKIFKGR